jgi:catechol 2,3-dioxygenase-like lactoylglutathione lyase family enzyme
MPIASGFIHVNINCTNLERSLDFYRMLGFQVRDKMDTDRLQKTPGVGSGFGLGIAGETRNRARLLALGDGAQGVFLDLIEWSLPRTEGRAYETLTHAGIVRIALRCDDVRKAYEELKAGGVTFVSEPCEARFPKWHIIYVCCLDPDGAVVELIQGPIFH